jgi:spoIIIJ-associated protein
MIEGAAGQNAENFEGFVTGFLEGLLRAGRLELSVEARRETEFLHVELEGPDSDLILENNAKVLYALEHVLNQVTYRRGYCESKALLDCNDYRNTRTLELQLLARKAAEKVKVSGAAISLQPMPAVERRIIHLALAEDQEVRTESSGLGTDRHVMILPGQ